MQSNALNKHIITHRYFFKDSYALVIFNKKHEPSLPLETASVLFVTYVSAAGGAVYPPQLLTANCHSDLCSYS